VTTLFRCFVAPSAAPAQLCKTASEPMFCLPSLPAVDTVMWLGAQYIWTNQRLIDADTRLPTAGTQVHSMFWFGTIPILQSLAGCFGPALPLASGCRATLDWPRLLNLLASGC
jgi:hypothetical protein